MTDRAPAGTPSGTGLLAVFCDLDRQWVPGFRPWLARDMFPPQIAAGFGPAASFDAVPSAGVGGPARAGREPQAFVTIYVAPTLGDFYGTAYQRLRAHRQPLDAAYHERMRNHARYTATLVGPGIERGAAGYAPILVIDRFELAPADTQPFNIWYETEYLPGLVEVAGLSRLRRYLAMEGEPRHLLIHELDDEQSLAGEAWQRLRGAGPWRHCRPAPGAPAAYRRAIRAESG